MKVALVYDRVNKWGGAERLLLALHQLFPDASLYTSVYNKEKATWAKVFKVKTSFLQHFPFASAFHEHFAPLMPFAFESFSFEEYDVVISVTSEAAKGIITSPNTIHICYCLTPTRYLWSGYKDYFDNPLFKAVAWPFVAYLRKWDRAAAQRPDAFISISKEVAQRVKRYYGRESVVVYPPGDFFARGPVSSFPPASAPRLSASLRAVGSPSSAATPFIKKENYFLVVSRLVPYKRVDLAIAACNKLKLPLKIIGTGSEEDRLKDMAGPTIEFLGNTTDEILLEYYKHCLAVIFPGHEDLGLVPIEAQSFGKPVIAFKAGGALETVVEGKTGEFFYPQNTKSLIVAIQKFQKMKYNTKDCVAQAEKFGFTRFKSAFMKTIEKQLQKKETL